MSRTCSMHRGDEILIQNFSQKTSKEETTLKADV